MKTKIHMCQSVSGALKNWTRTQWAAVAKDNGMTVEGLKQKFRIMEFEGKKVIQLYEGQCDNFSDQEGCLGHPVSE